MTFSHWYVFPLNSFLDLYLYLLRFPSDLRPLHIVLKRCFSNLAAIHAGGFSTGIYQTNTAAACQYIAADSRCNVSEVRDYTILQISLTAAGIFVYLRANVVVVGDIVQLKKVLLSIFLWTLKFKTCANKMNRFFLISIKLLRANFCFS